jgi:putative endopeptidase
MLRRLFVPLLALSLLACRTARSPSPATGTSAEEPSQGIDPTLVDAKADPCDDFYAYACGAWLAKTPIPDDQPRWSRGFTEVEERNLKLLRELLDSMARGEIDPKDRYGGKVADYYAACMDEGSIEQRGARDLQAAFAHIDALREPAALSREVALLHKNGVFPLFRIRSEQDSKDATQVVGEISQGGLSLPDRDYYLKDDPKTLALQQAFRAHVARSLSLAGSAAERAASDAEAIFALERSLAEAQWTRTEMRDPRRVYNRADRQGLVRLAPRFDWSSYLEELGHPDVEAFTATTPKFLERVNAMLEDTKIETWRAYLKWHLLSSMAGARALPNAFYNAHFAFVSQHFTGAKRPEPRWKDCVRTVDRGLGEALGQAFVRRHFGPEAKQKTRELVAAVEEAMGKDLDALAWMDEPTRRRAREKLAAVNNKVGYPEEFRRYDTLTIEPASFFNSLLAARAFEVNRDLSKIGKPLDRKEWHMTPPTVNAYYNPSMNEMVFPAGILQRPYFVRGAPDAVNYGAIGMVVGHELTHGFDDEGRQFDARGNLAEWWSPSVGAEFDRRAACVARQYEGYQAVDDVNVNGRLTLGENIADLGGLKLAYAAYQASRAGKPPEAVVAGFTPAQAFFLGFAQSWCTGVRPEFARLRALTDPHSPPRWRVNGPLSNLPEFRQAFSCRAGSRMVRSGEEQCEVW